MLSNAYFPAKFRFDTAENEPAENLQKFVKKLLTIPRRDSARLRFVVPSPFFTRSTDSTRERMAWRWEWRRFKCDFSSVGSDGSVSMSRMMEESEDWTDSVRRTSSRKLRW